jgi:hypothetical protein
VEELQQEIGVYAEVALDPEKGSQISYSYWKSALLKMNLEHIEKSRADLGAKKYPDQGQGFFN